MSDLFFYSLCYFLISACIVYPPIEFVAAGLTIKDIFRDLLGCENEFFVQYHIRRSIITLIVHFMLPIGNRRVGDYIRSSCVLICCAQCVAYSPRLHHRINLLRFLGHLEND